MMKKIVQKQLGEILVDSKLCTPEQITEALNVQKEKGGLLGKVLVDLGHATEEDIAKALMAQYGFPYLPLACYEVDQEVGKLIPEEVCRQYGVVAIDKVGKILTIVMSNPLNQQAVDDIEMITKLTMQVFVATVTDVNNTIAQVFKKS